MPQPGRTAEQKIARIATRAHGVVTRGELLRAGVSLEEIRHRLRVGGLIREYKGVYRAGHCAPSLEARYLSAVFACGPGAVLRGRAAGHLLRLLKGPTPAPEVLAPTERRIKGVRTRRSRRIDRRETTKVRGIPVTTVARTLVDMAPDLTLDELARACHEAGVLHRTTPRHVDAVLARQPNAPGAGRLRMIMRGEVHVVLSELERRFHKLLRDEGLPLPVTNRPAGGRRVDCRWPEHCLTVELDSWGYHNSSYSWKQGYRREREARTRGDEFRRYTWEDVTDDPTYILRELRQLFLRRRPA